MKFSLHTKHRQTAVIASAMMLLLSGCVKDKLGTGREGEVPLKLTLSIETAGEPDTKAPLMGPNFPAGTHNVGLVVSNSVSGTKPGYYNMLMSVTSDGKGNNTMKYYSSVDGKTEIKEITVDSKNGAGVTACYPRIEGLQNYSLIPFDLTTAAQKASQTDLLCSPRQTVTADNAANVPLVFKHVYAMLEFQVTKKNNDAEAAGIKQISINNKTGKTWVQNKGTMDAMTGGVAGTAAGSVVVDYADDVNKVEYGSYTTFRVMIPPFIGAYEDGDIEVTFIGLGEIAPEKLLIKKKHLSPMTGGTTAMKAGARYVFKLSYVLPKPATLEYGKAPHGTITTNLVGAGYRSYNDRYGSAPTNGAIAEMNAIAYEIEKPYAKFEIAPTDLPSMTWTDAKGTTPGGNICATTFGEGWRLPRISELRIIGLNGAELAKAEGFTALIENYYWSATESINTSNFVGYGFGIYEPTANDHDNPAPIRCIRELPVAPPTPPTPPTPIIVEYGKAPYGTNTTSLKTSTTNSYNGYYGDVAGGHNGEYYTNWTFAIVGELPYAKFEIAKSDISSRPMRWESAQGTALADNVCTSALGDGWRLPRAAELLLILNNKAALESVEGFEPFKASSTVFYWSATESRLPGVFAGNFSKGGLSPQDRTTKKYYIRCIREIYVPPIGNKTAAQTVVGDFSFSDGTFGDGAATLSAAQKAACIGIVYWKGDPTKDDIALKRDYPGCTNGMIVSLTMVQSPWQSASVTYNKTVNEWTIAKATGFTQPIISGDQLTDPINKIMGYNNTEAIMAFNASSANSLWKVGAVDAVKDYRTSTPLPPASSPWFLPSEKELSLLCGLDNQDRNVFEDAFGDANYVWINNQLAKASGTNISKTTQHWSSTEESSGSCWVIDFDTGGLTGTRATDRSGAVRFVRAF